MTRWRIAAAVSATALMFSSAALSACAVCFQMEPNSTTTGVHAAVVTLAAITIGVLVGFAVFIRRFARRERDTTINTMDAQA